MKKLLQTLLMLCAFIPLGAFAAPTVSFTPSLVPIFNDTYYLGTTSPSTLEWLGIFTKAIQIGNLGGSGTRCVQTDNNGVLSVASGACGSGSGGSGGGTFATTTSQVSGQFINYPLNNTDIVTVGNSSTTSAPIYFDPNISLAKIFNQFFGTSSTTLQSFTAVKSTTTNATTTNLGITGILKSLLATDANGTVVATSTIGNNQLQNSSITVNGTAISLGGSQTITAASSTLLADANYFSGNNTFANTITGSISGNAGTATKLQNARTINGVSFDGTANITVASTTLLGDSNYFSGANTFSNGLLTLSSTTLQSFTFVNASGTTATSTNSYVTNRLGIGTSTPDKLLTVDGNQSGGIVDFVRNAGASPAAGAYGTFNVGLRGTSLPTSGIGPAFTLKLNGIEQASIQALSDVGTNNGSLHLVVDQTGGPKEYITMLGASGATGVGTTTPAFLLQSASSTAPQLALTYGAGVNHWTLRNDGGPLEFATASQSTYATSSTVALTIDNNGFLTNPAARAASGNNCLHIDTNGKITNTGSDCGSGGSASSTLLTDNNGFTGLNTFSDLKLVTRSTTTNSTTTGAASIGFASTTNLRVDTAKSALLVTNSTGDVSAYGGASACSSNNFVTTISAMGGTTCGTSTISGVSLGGTLAALTAGTTLTSAGTYTGATARTFDIDLTHANTWTGNQMFVASTTIGAGTQGTGLTVAGQATTTNLLVTSSSTLQAFTFTNATGTNATTTNLYVSNFASTTNLFGSGLVTCTAAGKALTWSAGLFGCNSIAAGAASSTLLIDNNGFTGLNTFSDLSSILRSTTTQATSTNDYAQTLNAVTASSSSVTTQNLLALSSTTLQAFTFTNASGTNATSSGVTFLSRVQEGAQQPATSTAMNLDWNAVPQQIEYQLGTSATTITLINATSSAWWGSRKTVWVCNPGTTAGTLTWVGVEWVGTAPTQTTTANQCDVYSFDITRATSTSAYKVAGMAATGFQ